uniref:Uncharacterized protein n=1 Tax=Arundo donax TaxID=35708 RepID=A0A0A9AA07_ARUDO
MLEQSCNKSQKGEEEDHRPSSLVESESTAVEPLSCACVVVWSGGMVWLRGWLEDGGGGCRRRAGWRQSWTLA